MGLLTTVFGIECPNCGASTSGDARYCQNCGKKLSSSTQPSGTAPQPDYTPEHLRQQVLQSRSSLEGERKQVTVLFVDIADSQKIARSMSDEAWHRLLDSFFGILTRCIHQFEGTVNQYTGDGIMALFGAPIAHEDHAQRACYAALQIKHELQLLTQHVRQEHKLSLLARIGLNSGEVIVGRIGDDLRMDYTAQGATVGLAARLENLADGGQICMSATTHELAGNTFSTRRLGNFAVKGERGTLELFELRAVRAVRSQFEQNKSHLTPFVGRDAQLVTLQNCFDPVLQGKQSLTYAEVVADAGVGKSRLCYEFATHNLQTNQALYLEAHGVPHGQHLPLLPIIELTRHYFGIHREDHLAEARQHIEHRLQQFNLLSDAAVQTVLDFIGMHSQPIDQSNEPSGTKVSSATLTDGTPSPALQVNQTELFKLVKKLAAVGSQTEPTIVVLDDLHLFDLASLKFLNELMHTLQSSQARIMLLANYRPTQAADISAPIKKLSSHPASQTQIDLRPLDQHATRSLLDRWLGDSRHLKNLKQMIVERSAGNPFFVEAIVTDLVEEETLTGDAGKFKLLNDISDLKVPATVQALLTARVDRLPDDQKLLIQVAAVIGKAMPDRILYKASQLSYRRFQLALSKLLKQQLLFRRTIYPQAIYSFPHPLMQESVYQSLLSTQKRDLHYRVGHAAAKFFANRPERASSVAFHFDVASDATLALQWHQKAAGWARTHSLEDAIKHLQRIITLSESMPATEAQFIRLQASARILQLSSRRGITPDAAESLYRLGHEIASNIANQPFNAPTANDIEVDDLRLILDLAMGSIYAFSGHLQSSMQLYRQAVQQAQHDAHRIIAWVGLVNSQHMMGQNRQAIATLQEAIKLSAGDYDSGAAILGRSPLLSLKLHQIWLAIDQGETTIQTTDGANNKTVTVHQALQHAMELAEKRQEIHHQAWAHCLFGLLALGAKQPEEAIRQANKASYLVKQAGNRLFYVFSRDVKIQALMLNNDWPAAENAALATIEFVNKHTIGLAYLPMLYAQLSNIAVTQNDTHNAIDFAKKSLHLAEKYDTKGYAIEALLASSKARLHKFNDKRPLPTEVRKQISGWLDTAERLATQTLLLPHLDSINAVRQELAE